MPRHAITRLAATSFVIALLAIPAVGSSTLGATPTCRGLEATIVGDADSETINGTNGRDVIVAGDGDDWIFAGAGKDVICGGPGRDRIKGEDGEDRIFGQNGWDTLFGNRGFDRLVGGDGADACYRGEDGARLIDCEGADLKVNIIAPENRAEGAGIAYTVRVRNVGAKPARPFTVVVSEGQHGVDCGSPFSFELEWSSLDPGEWRQWPTNHPSGCQITGADPFMRIRAELKPKRDSNPANDVDTERVHITAP